MPYVKIKHQGMTPEQIVLWVKQFSFIEVTKIEIQDIWATVTYEPVYPTSASIETHTTDGYDHCDAFSDECVMCGKERPLNDEGYCGSCWQVWNS